MKTEVLTSGYVSMDRIIKIMDMLKIPPDQQKVLSFKLTMN